MIVSCPSCTTRYAIEAQTLFAPLDMACQACGQEWKELPTAEIIEHEPEPIIDIQALVETAKARHKAYLISRRAKARRTAGWAGFGFVALIPFIFALVAPTATVVAAPVTAKVFQKLGWNVNIYGLDIRRVEQRYQDVDGQHILRVKGEVSNATGDIRKMPSLRLALTDDKGVEVYSWVVNAEARPLRAGETTAFTTKISNPPETAKNLQIRFAHPDEIGANGA